MEEKLAMLEDMLDMDRGSLKPEMQLEDIAEWNSVTGLSFIVLLDENYDREISGKEIRNLKTVQDMLAVME